MEVTAQSLKRSDVPEVDLSLAARSGERWGAVAWREGGGEQENRD